MTTPRDVGATAAFGGKSRDTSLTAAESARAVGVDGR